MENLLFVSNYVLQSMIDLVNDIFVNKSTLDEYRVFCSNQELKFIKLIISKQTEFINTLEFFYNKTSSKITLKLNDNEYYFTYKQFQNIT